MFGFSPTKKLNPWDETIYKGSPQQISGFRSALLAEILLGKKIYFATTSKLAGRVLGRVFREMWPERHVKRVDGDTNESGAFTQFFEKPDILICSPSVKSGVSIQGDVSVKNAYFDSVWGYFPSLTSSTHLQLLGRFRPGVPRYIFVPEFIQAGPDEDSKAWFVRRNIKEIDREQAAKILKDTEIKAYHRLPRQALKAAAIAATGVLELIGKTYDNNSPQAQSVKAQALKYRHQIYQYLRLSITPNQTPVEIANKLLKKLGLEAECLSRKGSRDDRNCQYRVEAPSELRQRMVEAYSITLKNACPHFVNGSSMTNHGHTSQIENSDPNPPPRDRGGGCELAA